MKTITTTEIKAMNVSTFNVQDNSPRGIKTVTAEEIKPGDRVVIDNHFCEVVEAPEQEQAEQQDTTPITAEINSMCADCASLGNGCKGTACNTWTGCIYKRADAPSTAAVLDEALTAKHEEAKHFNDAMSERFDPISEIIILHAIANAAEEVYDNHPEDEHAERMFDKAYKDEWNAVESFVESLTAELKCSSNAARAAIWRYVDAHPVAFRDEHGTLEMELYSHAREAANRIAQRYYTADTNAVYISQGVEYTLSADSFKNPLLVHFVGFGKNENLFVPACNLGSFLPGVASEGMQIAKGV